MKRKVNKNLKFLLKNWDEVIRVAGIFILEGSSRSGKTWAIIYFLIRVCQTAQKENKKLTIHVIRAEYSTFKTSLFDDFKKILPIFGIHDSPFTRNIKNISEYTLFGCTFYFLGADNPNKSLGSGCDIAWYNEGNQVKKEVFNQKEQRCAMFSLYDYNPSDLEHYIYKLADHGERVFYLHSTMVDNPDVPLKSKEQLLSYEMTEANIKAGTANKYMQDVYLYGKRCAREGLIFPLAEEIREFPKDIEYWYGNDFGFTNDPNALVKFGESRDKKSVYIQYLIYEPIAIPDRLIAALDALGIEKEKVIMCDSSDRYAKDDTHFVVAMRQAGYNAIKVKKGKVNVGIDKLLGRKIYYVDSAPARLEFGSYVWDTINDMPISRPKQNGKDHGIDAARYADTVSNILNT